MISFDINKAKPTVEKFSLDNFNLEQSAQGFSISRLGKRLIDKLNIKKYDNECEIEIYSKYENIYGLGERFDGVNQKGKNVHIEVLERFCNQGSFSYCPTPFFMTNSGFGIYVETMAVSDFSFFDKIIIKCKADSNGIFPRIIIFAGTPKEMLSEFSKLTGETQLPPKWAFGAWASANRWNKEEDVYEQLEKMERFDFPHNVIVLEAWSDEATFYLWNGSTGDANDGSTAVQSIEYQGANWKDPKTMIEKLHEKNIKLILWQIPVLKLLTQDLQSEQHDSDCAYAKQNAFCVKSAGGEPYVIPEGNWFAGSVIPDFTNSKTMEWWFSKRQYLLEMGVDGFKTDGGEFIYSDLTQFSDQTTGVEMRNGYVKSYIKAYNEFVGRNRVLFSRAGYTGQQSFPIQWAGDQQSTWEELRHVLSAGLSAGLSGVAFWGYDIGGFAGPLPSVELYERSTQMAVFCPVMQWHSEPSGGQFSGLMPSADGINDRSPWNMAAVYKDKALLERLRFHYNLRTNLLPYIYFQAIISSKAGIPMLKHLLLEYPNDNIVTGVEDQFMLGELMVCPVIYEGAKSRRLYLPKGEWKDFYTGERLNGQKWYERECQSERIPVFVRCSENTAIALNLGDNLQLGSRVGNDIGGYKALCFIVTEQAGSSFFCDDLGNDFSFKWSNDMCKVNGICEEDIEIIKI